MKDSIAEILTIGDELLRGEIVDSNKAFLADRLLGLDIPCHHQASARQDPGHQTGAFRRPPARSASAVVAAGARPARDAVRVPDQT